MENTLFIVTAAEQVGVDEEIIREFLYHTKSLEHRMERFWQLEKCSFLSMIQKEQIWIPQALQ